MYEYGTRKFHFPNKIKLATGISLITTILQLTVEGLWVNIVTHNKVQILRQGRTMQLTKL